MISAEYKVEEVRSDPGTIGDLNYVIPAYKKLEVLANNLSRDNWKIIMMDIINTELIIAVFERQVHSMEIE